MKARTILAVVALALAACSAPTGDSGTGTGAGAGNDTGTVTGGNDAGGGGGNTETGAGGGGDTGAGGGTGTGTGSGGGTDTIASRVANIGDAGVACDAYAATLRQLALRHDQGALAAAQMADTFVIVKAVVARCEDPSPPVAGGEDLVRLQIASNALIGLTEGRQMSVLEMSATNSPFLLAENDQSLEADIEPVAMPAQVSDGLKRSLFNVAVAGSPQWAAYESGASAVSFDKAVQDWAGVNQRAKAARLVWEQSAG